MGVWEREGVYLVLLGVVLETEERRNEYDFTCSHTTVRMYAVPDVGSVWESQREKKVV